MTFKVGNIPPRGSNGDIPFVRKALRIAVRAAFEFADKPALALIEIGCCDIYCDILINAFGRIAADIMSSGHGSFRGGIELKGIP
ncbi:hypothetical protein GCM10011273_27130 [Asticcacaulis endophyticus]|uniref:Uncharacterized protein n=1 Tax=Asticcacaulis endophyticus TaxID=1395890 RepID=A0A918QCG8_9CAUL|nr:hypothetical protein GCM10011273_27130 [Asticcacaulis endophyticus]